MILPSRVVRHVLGEQQSSSGESPASGPVPPPVDARDENRARQISRAVRTAASRTPWRSDCYPQALTARLLLRLARVPHAVRFGLRRDASGDLRAHAWVLAGRLTVTGGSGHTWVGVGTFTWTPRSRRAA